MMDKPEVIIPEVVDEEKKDKRSCHVQASGCLIPQAQIIFLLGVGIQAVKYAWAFQVWAWNLTVTF